MDIATKVKRGGKVLALRQVTYMGLSFANTMVIARMLGPVNYGIASITLNYFFFVFWFADLGTGDYIVKEQEISDDALRSLASLQLVLGIVLASLFALAAPILAWASTQPEIAPLVRCVAIALLLEMLASFSINLMRRELDFAYVGGIEMLCQVFIYTTSLTLVFLGASYWAPIIGLMVGSLSKFILAYRKAPYPISLYLKKQYLKPALNFGLRVSGAQAMSNLKVLLVPLGVTPILGIGAAGIINLTVRLTQQLSLLRQVTRFMSLGVLSKFATDKERLARVTSKGMAYQALMIGPALALFAVFSTWLIPLVFGEEWFVSAKLFPAVALAFVILSVFDLHITILKLYEKLGAIALHFLAYFLLLYSSACLGMYLFGIWGYIIGQLFSTLSVFVLLRYTHRVLTGIDYSKAFGIVLFSAIPLVASVFMKPIPTFVVYIVSMTMLFIFSKTSREIVVEVLRSAKPTHS